MEIRPYRAADLDAVIAIFLAAIRETAINDYTLAQVEAWAQADREAWATRRLSRPTWVACIGPAVVGFTDLEADGHLDMMFVHPARQRTGIASALLDTAEQAARAQGLARLFTESSITARPFFAAHGFEVLRQQTVRRNGQDLVNFAMEKVWT
jgi:putative acetyltransferase